MGEYKLDTLPPTQNPDSKASPAPGQRIERGTTLVNRYLVQGVIGVGGMGAVYRARDLHFPNVIKLVAVKEMVNQAHDPLVRSTIIQNFEREANLLATLDHRSIPRIYDYFTINQRSYLVLEYINGKDLETVINDSPGFISESRAIAWGLELCDVLHYLHTHKPEPIIFRDMKPSNVMINPQDHIVLVDFGIAKQFQTGQRGTMVGTEGYSPPEQYRGEATPLADIYALGATLHHMLTRRDPRLEAPFSFGERPVSRINPQISPELEAVIYTAIQYTPADRYPSAIAMKEALLGVARKTGMLPPAITPVPSKPGENIKPIWTFDCRDEIRGTATYQDGAVFFGSYDHHLYALNSATGNLLWKYAADGGIVSKPIIFESNLYFGAEDHRLHVVTLRNGRINWTYFTDGPIRSSPSIAEGHVFFGSDDGYLHAVNTITGRRAWQIDVKAPVRSTPLVSHELVYFGTEEGELFCLDFAGLVKWRFKTKRAITSSPVISHGVVYFGSVDSTLYALDAKTGWVIWRFRLGKPSISTPCIADNLLFTGAIDGQIHCIELGSQKEVWRFATEHQVTGSPVIYKDYLYCGSVDGFLYCLEYRTGRLCWKFKTQKPVTGTPLVANDVVYIGSTDQCFYALLA